MTRDMSFTTKTDSWRYYDEEFNKLRQCATLPWQEPLHELLMRANLQPFKFRSSNKLFLAKTKQQILNLKILFLTKIEAMGAIINKTSMRNKTIMKLVKRFVISCLQKYILFKATHGPGKFNVLAYKMSRLEIQ